MDYSRSAGATQLPPDAPESPRLIPQGMTELAVAVGDLETAVRALAGRISPLLPGGSPFDVTHKGEAGNSPRPVRSHHAEELQTRVYQLREITGYITGMVKSIEI